MGNAVKVVLAAVVGYILGRKKKFKFAVGLGVFLGAKKLKIKPQEIVKGLRKEVAELPIVGELTDQTRDQLLTKARGVVDKVVAKWAGDLATTLTERTERLTGTATETDETDDEARSKEESEQDREPEEPEAEEEPKPEADEEPEESEKPAPKRRRTQNPSAKNTSTKRTTSAGGGKTRVVTGRKRAGSKERSDERE